MSNDFQPDIPGAEVIASPSFWPGRKNEWPVSGVVQHYTASLSERGLVKWMPQSKNSAHVFIFRNGHVVQMVKFGDRAFHAGEKMSKGFWPAGTPQPTNVNQFTIGIENCNAGWLIKGEDGKFYLPKKAGNGYVAGRPYKGPAPQEAADHTGKVRWWEPYSDKLVAANVEVIKRIVDKYPAVTMENIGFHSDVSPHRKTDPGPLWPHEHVLAEVFGKPEPVLPTPTAAAFEPDDDDDEIDAAAANRGDDNAEGEENPEWHYDHDAQMSMVDRVREPDE